MKAAFIAMCCVLAAALGLCFVSVYVHDSVLDDMDAVCAETIKSVRGDDKQTAVERVSELDRVFGERSGALEMLASHNDLHETRSCIMDAMVALECGDMDDAYQALVSLRGMLEHLRDHERLTLSNLL